MNHQNLQQQSQQIPSPEIRPRQKRQIPKRLQMISFQLNSYSLYLWVKVSIPQIIRGPYHWMLPSMERLVGRRVADEVMVVVQGLLGSRQGEKRDMDALQELEVMTLLTPQMGRKLKKMLMQQATIQPRWERFTLLRCWLLVTQEKSTFLNMIHAIWQQKSVSAKLSLHSIPTLYPCDNQLVATLTNIFMLSDTAYCMSHPKRTNSKSMIGNMQKKARVPVIPVRFLISTLNREGMPNQQTAISTEQDRQAKREFLNVTWNLCFSWLAKRVIETRKVITHDMPTKAQSQEYLLSRINIVQSRAHMMTPKTLIPTSFLLHDKGASMSRSTIILATFHMIQLKVRVLIMVPTEKLGWVTVADPTTRVEMVDELPSQQGEMIPGAVGMRLMKQIPTYNPRATITKITSTRQKHLVTFLAFLGSRATTLGFGDTVPCSII